jgi:hypothetical protein
MMDATTLLAWGLGIGLALSGPALPLFAVPGGAGGLLLVVVPPWEDGAGVIDAAGGWLVGPDQPIIGIYATSDAGGFAGRLRAAGAWLVLDGQAVATLCGSEVT